MGGAYRILSTSSELPGSLKRVLEVFEKVKKPMTPEEMARRLGVRRQTAKKYMDQLVKRGYLVKRPDGTYYLAGEGESSSGSGGGSSTGHGSSGSSSSPTSRVVRVAGEPFYFVYQGSPVTLAVRSLEQLYAIVRYRIVEPEVIAWLISMGYLQAWLRSALGAEDVARAVDGLKGLSAEEVCRRLSEILERLGVS